MSDTSDMPDVFGTRKGAELIDLIKARSAFAGAQNTLEENRGTGKNDYDLGIAAQKHKLEIDRLVEELKPKIVGV